VDSPLSVDNEHEFSWLADVHPAPTIHVPPDSDEEHNLVTDDDENLVGVIARSKRARLAAEAAKKLKKK
jgi:hypothetical protein